MSQKYQGNEKMTKEQTRDPRQTGGNVNPKKENNPKDRPFNKDDKGMGGDKRDFGKNDSRY